MIGNACSNHPDRPVHGRGLCSACYRRWWHETNRDKHNARRREHHRANPDMKRAATERYRQSHRKEIAARRRARYAADPEHRERHRQRLRDRRAAAGQASMPRKPKPVKVDAPAIVPEKPIKEVIAEMRAKYWNPDGTKKEK